MTEILQPRVTVNVNSDVASGPAGVTDFVDPGLGPGVVRFDNTYWESANNGTWNSTTNSWQSTSSADTTFSIETILSGPNLNWQVGFRPTHVRVVLDVSSNTSSTCQLRIESSGNVLFSLPVIPSNVTGLLIEGPMDFTANEDIEFFDLQANNGTDIQYNITNIEFIT